MGRERGGWGLNKAQGRSGPVLLLICLAGSWASDRLCCAVPSVCRVGDAAANCPVRAGRPGQREVSRDGGNLQLPGQRWCGRGFGESLQHGASATALIGGTSRDPKLARLVGRGAGESGGRKHPTVCVIVLAGGVSDRRPLGGSRTTARGMSAPCSAKSSQRPADLVAQKRLANSIVMPDQRAKHRRRSHGLNVFVDQVPCRQVTDSRGQQNFAKPRPQHTASGETPPGTPRLGSGGGV